MRQLFAVFLFSVLVNPVAAPFAAAQLSVVADVAGTVADGYGEPVAGVLVQAVSSSGYRVDAITGADGSYLLSALLTGSYAVRYSAVGYLAHDAELDLAEPGRYSHSVVLRPVLLAGLRGRVLDPQGLALPGALVALLGPGGAPLQLVTDAGGVFSVSPARPGQWHVSAALPGFGEAVQLVDVGFAQTVSVDLVLELDYAFEETVVVVGTRRAQGRPTVTDSPVPVDVLTAQELRSQPSSDMSELVRVLSPSFNVNTQPISDAATVMRPVNFRNLAPDHLLVLVNGKRRHRGAVIAWLGNGLSDGSQGPDVSTIPAIAVRQVELLKDGAAAQYGSDAIAGVLNFQLKDARQGASFEVRRGLYSDLNTGDPLSCAAPAASCDAIGGRAGGYTVAGNVGLPLGEQGFVNLSMEYGGREPTNRAVQREDARRVGDAGGLAPRDTAQVWGQPLVEDDLKVFANMGTVFDSGLRPYAHANYASRTVTGGFYYRHPHTRSGVFRGPEIDGNPSLLVGDSTWAETGVPRSGGCPAVPVVGSVPDPAALAAVEAMPQCFTLFSRFPGGFHAPVRRRHARPFRGGRRPPGPRERLHLGPECLGRSEPDRPVHHRYGQRFSRLRHAYRFRARRLRAGGDQLQLRYDPACR